MVEKEGKQMMSVLGELLEKSLIRRAALGSVQEPLYVSLWGPCTPFGKRNPESSSPDTFLELISMRANSIGGLNWGSRYLCAQSLGPWKIAKWTPEVVRDTGWYLGVWGDSKT